MKFTSVAVVLLLAVLCGVAVSAPACGENGVQDYYATKYCSCFSGFAPSNYNTQTDCDAELKCPAYEPTDRTSFGGHSPFLFNSSFVSDRYNVIIRVPLVTGRLNSTVRIRGGPASCGYPGNMWGKRASKLDCVDEIVGSIPWSANSMCGFKKTVVGVKTSYSATLVVSYDEEVSDAAGTLIRTIGTGINVNITFTTRTSVIYSLINLSPGLTLVTVSVLGNVIYDANTGLATVTLRTSATWPYMVAQAPTVFSTPSPNTASIAADSLYDVNATCTSLVNTDCQQQYIMRINPHTGCNLGGNYVFNITLLCRSEACGATYKAGSYSVLIYNTDVCGVGGVDVGLANGQLIPFSDAAGTTPSSAFVPNNDVYFAFTLSSDQVTIDGITVRKISAATGSVEDVFYDLDAVGTNPGLSTKGIAAGLTVTPALTPAAPGVPATMWFHIKLVDSISSFRVLPDTAATVTMSVVVDLNYHGVGKRTVMLTFDAEATSTTSSQGLADIYISPDGVTPNMLQENNSGSSLAISPIFIVLALALMLIFNH